MKTFLSLLIVASLIVPSQAAFAQVRAPAPAVPGGPNLVGVTCPDTFSLPGFRVTDEDISGHKDAAISYLEECSEGYIMGNFALANATAAIEANKKLKAYLRHQGVSPQDVVAARVVRGELVVYVKNV